MSSIAQLRPWERALRINDGAPKVLYVRTALIYSSGVSSYEGFHRVNDASAAFGFMKAKSKPVHEIRLGAIKAAIWKNDTTSGVKHNVTFTRLYKDGEEWKSTDSFGRDDLLLVAKVADQAHSWIHNSES